jgi:hypothetical protein
MDRSIDRQIARNSPESGEKLPLFIRVAESQIYNGKPLHKAMLKEVIYLRATDLHEGDKRIPNFTPWSSKYKGHINYEGWCWARQEYLANRIGCGHTHACRILNQIIKDGYLKTRKYRSKNGAWHKQYFPDESVIDAKIEELGAVVYEEDSETLLHDAQEAYCATRNYPIAPDASGLLRLTQNPIAPRAKEVGVVSTPLKYARKGGVLSTPPTASPTGAIVTPVAPLLEAKEKSKTNGNTILSSGTVKRPTCKIKDCPALVSPTVPPTGYCSKHDYEMTPVGGKPNKLAEFLDENPDDGNGKADFMAGTSMVCETCHGNDPECNDCFGLSVREL